MVVKFHIAIYLPVFNSHLSIFSLLLRLSIPNGFPFLGGFAVIISLRLIPGLAKVNNLIENDVSIKYFSYGSSL